MTVKELYEYCKEKYIEDYSIIIQTDSGMCDWLTKNGILEDDLDETVLLYKGKEHK